MYTWVYKMAYTLTLLSDTKKLAYKITQKWCYGLDILGEAHFLRMDGMKDVTLMTITFSIIWSTKENIIIRWQAPFKGI